MKATRSHEMSADVVRSPRMKQERQDNKPHLANLVSKPALGFCISSTTCSDVAARSGAKAAAVAGPAPPSTPPLASTFKAENTVFTVRVHTVLCGS
jgi:hypothetical protein